MKDNWLDRRAAEDASVVHDVETIDTILRRAADLRTFVRVLLPSGGRVFDGRIHTVTSDALFVEPINVDDTFVVPTMTLGMAQFRSGEHNCSFITWSRGSGEYRRGETLTLVEFQKPEAMIIAEGEDTIGPFDGSQPTFAWVSPQGSIRLVARSLGPHLGIFRLPEMHPPVAVGDTIGLHPSQAAPEQAVQGLVRWRHGREILLEIIDEHLALWTQHRHDAGQALPEAA